MPNWNDGPKLNLNGLTEFKQKLDELFAKKADNNGHYSDMTVGNAEQLISTVGIEDRVPYNFRRSGGGADVGDREVDKLVGGTIAWNQLVQNGDFSNGTTNWAIVNGTGTTSDKVLTFTGNGQASEHYVEQMFTTIAGHKYLVIADLQPNESGASSWVFRVYYNGTASNTSKVCSGSSWQTKSVIVSNTTSATTNRIRVITASDYSGQMKVRNPQIYDLTQMFGSTIADYIYTLETTHEGDGVAYFRSLFPKAYYPYNAGELMSVNTSAHEMVGFNQWDEEWENGYYDRNTGSKAGNSNTTYIRSKNYIPCLPSLTYYYLPPRIHASNNTYYAVLFYDKDKNFISAETVSYSQTYTATAPSTAKFMTFYVEIGTTGATYRNDICVNLSSSKNGTYEPYQKYTYPLDDSLTLRGIPKLDANNNLYYDGDTYESDGTVTRRYGVVDLGTLSWSVAGSDSQLFSADVSGLGVTTNMICKQFLAVNKAANDLSAGEMTNPVNGKLYVYNGGTWSDAAAFKTAMSGVYLVYELATPTTETADPYTNPQNLDPYGTEEYVDERTVAVPVGHDTLYLENLRAKIEGLPWDMSMLAPIENGATASQAYAQGKYFMRNNQFCKAKTSIASGATFTLGTNYEVTTVGAELYSALNS